MHLLWDIDGLAYLPFPISHIPVQSAFLNPNPSVSTFGDLPLVETARRWVTFVRTEGGPRFVSTGVLLPVGCYADW